MAANQDSLSKGFDSTSNLGAEGSMARQTNPMPPGSTQIASTTGVPKPSLTLAKPKPATVTIRERPQPPPASAQVTIKERPQPPPGPAKVTIRERPQPQAKSSKPSIKSPPPQRPRPPILRQELTGHPTEDQIRAHGMLSPEEMAQVMKKLRAAEQADKAAGRPPILRQELYEDAERAKAAKRGKR